MQDLDAATAPKDSVQRHAAARLELAVIQLAGAPIADPVAVVCEGDAVRVGAHSSNDLVVADPQVSRFHFRMLRTRDRWVIVDSGSLNGTSIGDVRVRDADLPSPECVVSCGSSRVRVRELSPVSTPSVLDRANFGDLYGTSLPMRKLFAVLEKVAMSDANVFIEGESGTGKELVAMEVVRRGPRARKPLIVVDCGAIAPNLIESELFGHVKGAFTGAHADRVGAFEAAHGGTVFLDEIGELPLALQPKLLRALEARELRRVGESKTRKVDVRVIAATNRSLEREVNLGTFREDLYFRLSVVGVRVPPLRERPEDIEILVRSFLDDLDATSSSALFTPEVLRELQKHDWPGNVRELRNWVERAIVLQQADFEGAASASKDREGDPVDIEVPFREAKDRVIAGFERAYLSELLQWSEGNVSRAARKAQIDRMHLHRLIQRYDLKATRALRD